MSALSLTIIRVAFLAVLWLFVIAAIGVVRTDLLGGSATSQRRSRGRQTQNLRPPRQARQARPQRAGRGSPRILVVTAGALKGTSLDLAQQQITLGRANDATLVLNDDYASSRHARIFPQDGQWIVEDLGSTNGTFVNSEQITQAMRLGKGDLLQIGSTVFEVSR